MNNRIENFRFKLSPIINDNDSLDEDESNSKSTKILVDLSSPRYWNQFEEIASEFVQNSSDGSKNPQNQNVFLKVDFQMSTRFSTCSNNRQPTKRTP